LSLRGAQLDDTLMQELGTLFVMLWQRKPRDVYWYGDLRQSFVPYNLQPRLAALPDVAAQLSDFRSFAAVERARPTDLGCRRLDRACELLLHAPPEECRTTLLSIVRLDYIDRPRVARMSPYETVYWGLVRILRKLGEDI
jgi:hypothetical protein